MTAATGQSTFSHNTDAEFRVWGKHVHDMLTLAGLTQAADTGQINWATAVRGAPNAMAGYEIYRFNDALQATAPVFIRLEYRTFGFANRPGIYMYVGTATDGAGTLLGQSTGTLDITYSTALTPTVDMQYPSYVCKMDGYVGAMFGGGAGSSYALCFFVVDRFRDDAGAPVNEGVAVYFGASARAGELRFPTPASWTNVGNAFCLVPGMATLAAVDDEVQVFRHYFMPVRRVRGVNGICTHMQAEFGQAALFTVDLYPGDPHQYLALGSWTTGFSTQSTPAHCAAIRFEA